MKNYSCIYCQSSFLARRKDNVFCSKKCKCASYRQENLEKISQYKKLYYQDNKEQEDAKTYAWREENQAAYKEYVQNYYKDHKAEIVKRVSAYNTLTYQEDIQFRLKNIIRRRLGRLHLKKFGVKSYSALYGASIKQVVQHIEKQFYAKNGQEMSWGNYGKDWQIDHITPLALFDLTNKEQLETACSYNNLQPLWKADHKIKTKQDLLTIKEYTYDYKY